MKKKKPKVKLKKYNVFYTPYPTEYELIVNARSLKEAVKKAKELMNEYVDTVRGGWEIR